MAKQKKTARRKEPATKNDNLSFIGLILAVLLLGFIFKNQFLSISSPKNPVNVLKNDSITIAVSSPTLTPSPPVITPTTQQNYVQPSPVSNNTNWGKVNQTGNGEYSSNFNSDSRMATPQEIAVAVNNYRQANGMSTLNWDDGLAAWAQSRAQYYVGYDLDDHAGFLQQAPDKSKQLGFSAFGEDGGKGGALLAVHLIEWTYAQDTPHREQILGNYSHIGVGVATNNNVVFGNDIIFGR